MNQFSEFLCQMQSQSLEDCDDSLFLGSKCQGGNADWSCCKSSNPCRENEGDCDTDSDCLGELVCGTNNCPSGFPASEYDCCESPSAGLLIHL